MDFVNRLFCTVLESKRMSEEWRRTVVALIFNTGDV